MVRRFPLAYSRAREPMKAEEYSDRMRALFIPSKREAILRR
jgi:hypothetical protein